ncbi:hypothetical protein H4R34_001962 [Dimargaris verticillata]|uniref:Peptidase A1 domain-containing protein n=1 Tax=Dimargaris verticillata TaxID=2761393 RepID=A0A9W8B531_9FUNG|nr:hypothetical protein H4R34_001962 [Dimargaris verticillata]
MGSFSFSLLYVLAWCGAWMVVHGSEAPSSPAVYRLEIPVYRKFTSSDRVALHKFLTKAPPKAPSLLSTLLSNPKPPIFPAVYNEFSDLYINVEHGVNHPKIAKLRLDGRGYDLWLVDKVADKRTQRTFELARDDSEAYAKDPTYLTPKYLHLSDDKMRKEAQELGKCQATPHDQAMPLSCTRDQGTASATGPIEDTMYKGLYQSKEIEYRPAPLSLGLGGRRIHFPQTLPVAFKVPPKLKETFGFDGVFGLSAATNEEPRSRSRFLSNMRLGGPNVYFTLDIFDHVPHEPSYTVYYGGGMIPLPQLTSRDKLERDSTRSVGSLVVTNHYPVDLKGGLVFDAGKYSLFTVKIANLVMQVGSERLEMGEHVVHFDPSVRYMYFPEQVADQVNRELGAEHPDTFYAAMEKQILAQSQSRKLPAQYNPFPALYGFINGKPNSPPTVSFNLDGLTASFEFNEYLISAQNILAPSASELKDKRLSSKFKRLAKSLGHKVGLVNQSNSQASTLAAQPPVSRSGTSGSKPLTYSGFARHNGDQSYTKQNVIVLGEMFFRKFITGFAHLGKTKQIILKPKPPVPESAGPVSQSSSQSPSKAYSPPNAEMDGS